MQGINLVLCTLIILTAYLTFFASGRPVGAVNQHLWYPYTSYFIMKFILDALIPLILYINQWNTTDSFSGLPWF